MSKLESQGTKESQAYFNFINTIKSQSTKELYENNIKLFMKFCNVDSFEDLLKIDAQPNVIQYVMSLREKKLASNSIRSRLNPVFHFYDINDVPLNKKRIKKFNGEFTKKARDRAYSREEIAKILNVSDLRMKVIILLMASTGMRVGALPSLKLRNLEKIEVEPGIIIYKITIYEGSSEEYYSFTTLECASSIDAYKEYRTNNGENLTDDSYLIRDQFDIRDIEQIRNKSKGVAINTIKSLIGGALLRAGVRNVDHTSKYNRKNVARCHGFRKFANREMINSDVNLVIKEILLGHSVGLEASYYRPSQDKTLQEYRKAINNLTINEENRLKIKVQKLEGEKNDVQSLKTDVEKLKADFQEKLEKFTESFWQGKGKIQHFDDKGKPAYFEYVDKEGKIRKRKNRPNQKYTLSELGLGQAKEIRIF